MFTGLVQELGKVEAVDRDDAGARLRIETALAGGLREGDSVCVNGACLTAVALDGGSFAADVMNRTLELTTLGDLHPGARVNLEPALRAGDPLGGHIVQGHVDGVAEMTEVVPDGIARRVSFRLPDGLERYAVERGSIALDGVSLTVAAIEGDTATVSLIPETLERTTLGAAAPGVRLNVELDVFARYVEKLVQGFKQKENPNG